VISVSSVFSLFSDSHSLGLHKKQQFARSPDEDLYSLRRKNARGGKEKGALDDLSEFFELKTLHFDYYY